MHPGVKFMNRPEFTKDEEVLISYARIKDKTLCDHLLQWSIWIVASIGLFLYGFLKEIDACIFAGFTISIYQLCRLVYYQVKPSWQIGPIIEKYEDAFREDRQHAPPAGRGEAPRP